MVNPGISHLQPTPGYKGDEPGQHDRLVSGAGLVGRLFDGFKTLLTATVRQFRRALPANHRGRTGSGR
ncbi:MAG TPA: hypothetical protein VE442_02685 [Jatrophihabitans sp.]|jgi:hypothetical protein|nr:hypothetical protein [Jatrophihabitans sp.]